MLQQLVHLHLLSHSLNFSLDIISPVINSRGRVLSWTIYWRTLCKIVEPCVLRFPSALFWWALFSELNPSLISLSKPCFFCYLSLLSPTLSLVVYIQLYKLVSFNNSTAQAKTKDLYRYSGVGMRILVLRVCLHCVTRQNMTCACIIWRVTWRIKRLCAVIINAPTCSFRKLSQL